MKQESAAFRQMDKAERIMQVGVHMANGEGSRAIRDTRVQILPLDAIKHVPPLQQWLLGTYKSLYEMDMCKPFRE